MKCKSAIFSFFWLIFISQLTYSQKLIYRQKDNFSDLTTFATSQVVLVAINGAPTVQASGWIQKNKDSALEIRLNISTPATKVDLQTSPDSTQSECLLKTVSGKIIKGEYKGDSKASLYGKYVHGCTYKFQLSDLQVLALEPVTDIKFTTPANGGGTFEITSKNQGNIQKIANLLLSAK